MQLVHLAHKWMRPTPSRPNQENRLANFFGMPHEPEMGLPHNLFGD